MGNNLRTLREAAGLTQPEAADAMGMSASGYIKLERGERRLTADYISRAAQVFGVHPSAIFDDDATDLSAQRVPLDRVLAAAQGILEGVGQSKDQAAALIQAMQEAAQADLSPLENGALLTATTAIARNAAKKSSEPK